MGRLDPGIQIEGDVAAVNRGQWDAVHPEMR
jgi:hypothetical protein